MDTKCLKFAMADKDKKPNFMLWIAIGIGVLIIVLGIAFYTLWKRISEVDIRTVTMDKKLQDQRAEIVQLKGRMDNKDDKIQSLTNQLMELEKQHIKLSFELERQVGKSVQPTTRVGSRKVQCTDAGCEEVVQDME